MIKQYVKFFGLFIFCTIALTIYAIAQQISVEAVITRVTKGVKIIEAGSEIAIKRNMQLSPGQIIKTGNQGRLDISLSDRSQVTILPNSTVKLNEFRNIGSPRDLLTVLAGKIKVRINHPIGIPNPYKLSTPAASIAVRGTEFIVDVESNGSTSVFVIDGLVEVESISKPSNKRLLSTGEKAIIKLTGDISLNVPAGPGSELNGVPRSRGGLDWSNRQMTEGVFIKSIGSPPISFTAYSDKYADSAENPAYSMNFTHMQGRISLLPAIGRRQRYHIYKQDTPEATSILSVNDANKDKMNLPSKWDQNINTQLSFYTPVLDSRIIVGATVSSGQMNLRDFVSSDYTSIYNNSEYHYKYHLDNDFKLNATKINLSAAMYLDKKKKTAVGVTYEFLYGRSKFLGVLKQETSNPYLSFKRINGIKSDIKSNGITLGITHEFSEGKKLGLHARVGSGKSDDASYIEGYSKSITPYFPSPDINCSPEYYDSSVQNTLYEVGLKWRSPLFKGLSYGLEGSYVYEAIRSPNRSAAACQLPQYPYGNYSNNVSGEVDNLPTPVITSDPSRRARIGIGLGYKFKSRTLLSIDFTESQLNSTRSLSRQNGIAASYSSPFPSKQFKTNFSSYHVGVINNPWKQALLSFSLYNIPVFQESDFRYKTFLYTLGAGWNFKSGMLAQYYMSQDRFSSSSRSHSIMLRWNFDLKGEK